jgi:excisionase family DNA binding protein
MTLSSGVTPDKWSIRRRFGAVQNSVLLPQAILRAWSGLHPVGEVAAELGCSEDDVRGLIRDGELQTVACGIRPGLVPRHELDVYLRRLQHRLRSSNPA